MILFDFNQSVIGVLASTKGQDLDLNLVRHIVLNNIRLTNLKFREEFGSLVICCDSKIQWRKTFFPYYKAHRKAIQAKSGINWKLIFECIDKIKNELRENFSYKVLEISGAEADDIIATLILNSNEKNLIVSSDKDFIQLQVNPGVFQWSPLNKNWVKDSNPAKTLQEHIILGDRGDGIPNMLSADDCFVAGVRQRSISHKKLSNWTTLTNSSFCENEKMLRGYKRNEALINLSLIPADISDKIKSQFGEETPKRTKMELMNYFIANGLSNLIDCLQDF